MRSERDTMVLKQLHLRRINSHLQSTEDAGVVHTLMRRQLSETTAEDIEVPQNLREEQRSVNKDSVDLCSSCPV